MSSSYSSYGTDTSERTTRRRSTHRRGGTRRCRLTGARRWAEASYTAVIARVVWRDSRRGPRLCTRRVLCTRRRQISRGLAWTRRAAAVRLCWGRRRSRRRRERCRERGKWRGNDRTGLRGSPVQRKTRNRIRSRRRLCRIIHCIIHSRNPPSPRASPLCPKRPFWPSPPARRGRSFSRARGKSPGTSPGTSPRGSRRGPAWWGTCRQCSSGCS